MLSNIYVSNCRLCTTHPPLNQEMKLGTETWTLRTIHSCFRNQKLLGSTMHLEKRSKTKTVLIIFFNMTRWCFDFCCLSFPQFDKSFSFPETNSSYLKFDGRRSFHFFRARHFGRCELLLGGGFKHVFYLYPEIWGRCPI